MALEQFNKLDSKLRLTNILLIMLLGIVSGYFLAQGVSGYLWFLCLVISIYATVMLSVVLVALLFGAVAYVFKTLAVASQTDEVQEDERLQALNEIYKRINPSK